MAPKKKKAPPTPWEIAKPTLLKCCLDGDTTDSMKPSEVWEMQMEFLNVKYENFRNNFAAMKRSIKKNKGRAEADEAGFLHDVTLHNLAKDTDGCWDGSAAQSLLKRDIQHDRHKRMKPEILWLSRQQHKEFPLTKFRGHAHQELRSQRETNCWIVKKKKKELAEQARREGKKFNDEDMDFLYDPVLDMQCI